MQHQKILSLRFNRTDANIIIACTNTGFVIFQANPYHELKRYSFNDEDGVKILEMYFRTNILAIVRQKTSDRVTLWDARQDAPINGDEITCNGTILSVKYHTYHFIAVLEDRIIIHDTKQEKAYVRLTLPNPKGICVFSVEREKAVVAYPGKEIGNVEIEDLISSRRTQIQAHNGSISCLALNYDGTLVATASTKGTLIRIFETSSGNKVRELRRGSTQCTMNSIAFSHDNVNLACTSDKGTLHVWNIANHKNRTSTLTFLKYVVDIDYMASEWSMSSYSGIGPSSECAFPPDKSDTVYILNSLGNFLEFKVEQSDTMLQETHNIAEDICNPCIRIQ